MDVDVNPSTSSGQKRPASGSPESSAKRAKLNLPPEQLDSVSEQMTTLSKASNWLSALSAADEDSGVMTSFMTNVLMLLTAKLSQSTMVSNSEQIVKGFSPEERKIFVAGLSKGVREHDWTDLVSLHASLQVATVEKQSLPRGVPIEHQHAVIHAWKAKYLGTSHRLLLKEIDHLNNKPPASHYAKIIAIIQSSGTGKSKTVDEIAKERVLLPLVLREEIGNNYFAYPPVDTVVRNHLLGTPSVGDELKSKNFLRAFLISLFRQTLKQMNKFIDNKRTSYLELAKMFYDLFSNPSTREEFYTEVVENASSVDNTDLPSALRFLMNTLRLCNNPPNQSCLLLFGIDEVHLLFEQRKEDVGSNYTIFSRLKSIISELVVESLCVVLLSTAGTVSELAPSPDVAPSIRERDDERILPTPFTQLPFDVDIVSDPLVPGKETLSSVGVLSFAAKFGRPMFYASYKSRLAQGVGEDVIAKDMMTIIREKLCGIHWPPSKPAVMDPSSFAVLSARLLLDLSPASSHVRKYEEDQVRSHLRMLYSVLRDKGVIFTGSSPEPLIAEASAEVMHHRMPGDSPYMDLWGLLLEFINDGLIAQGTIGEIIGRVLSLLAMDDAIDALTDQSQLKYQAPVSVVAYYKALLTDDAWNILQNSVPKNASKLTAIDSEKTFANAFQDAYFHFSHYAKANDDTPLRDQYLWSLWLRGTAILCQLNQPLTDRALPIYFSKLGNVGPNTMSVALDQDKTGSSVNPTLVSVQSTESIHSGPAELPYIDCVHCYGRTKNEGITVGEPSFLRRRTHRSENLEAPRYRIEISGLGPYRHIDQQCAHKIHAMIDGAKNALFIHHPSQDAVPLLHQQQPMLNGDASTTAWFGCLEGLS